MSARELTRIFLVAAVIGIPIGIAQRAGEWSPGLLWVVMTAATLVAGFLLWHRPGRRH